jgi:hypothetical protein
MNRIRFATAGLFVAWLTHDLEELLTMSDTSRTLVQQLPDWMPVPGSIREQGLTTRYLATGITAIGLIVAAAAIRGYRTQGRSAFYQNTPSGGPHQRARGAIPMSHVTAMLDAYPKDLGNIDRQKLADCIHACFACGETCTACADACLSEDMVAELTKCIRTNLDCADICTTTGTVLSRHTGYDANITRAILEACRLACASCATECEAHADMHEHCRICAEACRRCEQACADLLGSLG